MKFTPSFQLTVELPGDNEVRHSGVLYGSIGGECLIVGGFADFTPTTGEELIVRAAIGGHIIGFWAQVIDKIERAGTFYLLTYPEQVEKLDLRKAERMDLFVPTRIELRRENGQGERVDSFDGALVNLSRDGCCISAGAALDENLWCTLSFTLPGSQEVFQVQGRVVRKKPGAGEKERVGVEFAKSGPSAPAVGEIRDWLSSSIALLR